MTPPAAAPLTAAEAALAFYTAGAKRGRGERPPAGGGGGQPAARTIKIVPQDPPVFAALPATWTPTVEVAGMGQAKWAVFHVSATGAYSSDMLWQTVDTAAGSFVPSAPIQQERDRLVVKSLDDAVEAVSGGAVLNAPPPAATDGLTAARAFVSDLTVGINIEREALITANRITTAQLQQYKDQGCTHVRLFANWGTFFNKWPTITNGDGDWLFNACERAMAVGLKVQLDLLDIMFPNDMNDARVMPLLRNCAQRIRARNWDAARYAVGAAQEYGGGTNAQHRAKMHEAVATLRKELPNSLLVCASAYWNDPGALLGDTINGTAMGTFVPPPDDRVIVQWHKYDYNAERFSAADYWNKRLLEWAQANNRVTFCGEYGLAPPAGGPEVGPNNYHKWPAVVDAASRGMGQQRPTFWTVTDGQSWRLNKGSLTSSAELQDGVATNLKAGDAHIRAQSWFQPVASGGGGGTTPTPPANQVTRLQVLHRGQSNAYYASSYGADTMLKNTLAALTQLPVDMVSRLGTADDSTIHSGTYSYWDSPYNGDPRWLEPTGNDYASAPSGWANKNPMAHTLNAVSRFVSDDQSIPLYDLELHWEYDLAMEDAASKAAYREGYFEKARRVRAARPKAAGKHVGMRGHCPYQGGSWNALNDINAAWAADFADAARNVFPACGNMMDGEPNTQYIAEGDLSHWGNQSGPRIYPRIAFRIAKHAYDQGWLPSGVDLSDCPSMGPRMASAAVSGNSLTVTVAHDKGGSLVAGADGTDWTAFTATTSTGGSSITATGGAILSGNQIRVDFAAAPPATGRVWYCRNPTFRRKRLIRDDWHAVRPAKYAAVPNVAAVEFPLRRSYSGVAY